jgi:hypothetical protein
MVTLAAQAPGSGATIPLPAKTQQSQAVAVVLAGPTDVGWRIINVVPSQEQFEAFAREKLFPAVQQAENVTPQLTFFPVYKLIRA